LFFKVESSFKIWEATSTIHSDQWQTIKHRRWRSWGRGEGPPRAAFLTELLLVMFILHCVLQQATYIYWFFFDIIYLFLYM